MNQLENIFNVFSTLASKLARNVLIALITIVTVILMLFTDGQKTDIYEVIAEITEVIEEKKKPCKFNEESGIWEMNPDAWKEVSNDVLATVYNAVPKQCNGDPAHTASMFALDRTDVLSHRIIAMERTFMDKLGLVYGDVVYIEGTEKWDGPWQIQDTMNKRFAGKHKIDILVPNNIKKGLWNDVKISIPTKEEYKEYTKSLMRPSV